MLRPMKRLKLELNLLRMKLAEKEKIKRAEDTERLQEEVKERESKIKLLQLKLKKRQLKNKERKIRRKLRS